MTRGVLGVCVARLRSAGNMDARAKPSAQLAVRVMGSIHQCLREGRYQQVLYLMKLEADLDELDENLHTPLIRICHSDDLISPKVAVSLMRLLIRGGADGMACDREGLSILHIASKNNRMDLVKEVFALLPDFPLNNKDVFGNTPLHYAMSHESTTLAELLLRRLTRYKVNIDERNQLGFTPLLIAASNGCLDGARLLCETDRVSLEVTDSLYFKTTYDWLAIYYSWKEGENIMSSSTAYTRKHLEDIQVTKRHLTPVETTPANDLLSSFAKQQSAVDKDWRRKQQRVKRTISPKLVVCQSSQRPRTQPEWRNTIQRREPPPEAKTPSNRLRVVTSDGRSQDVMNKQRSGSEPYEMVTMVKIVSEQLSNSYRPPVTPRRTDRDGADIAESPRYTNLMSSRGNASNDKDGPKARDVIIGALGKLKRQTTGSREEMGRLQEEEGTSSRAGGTLRTKLLKYAAAKRALSNGDG